MDNNNLIISSEGYITHIDNQYIRIFRNKKMIFKYNISMLNEICLHIPTALRSFITKNKEPEIMIDHLIDAHNTFFELGRYANVFYISIYRDDAELAYMGFERSNIK